MPNTFDVERLEKRIPMTVAVHISGANAWPGWRQRSPRTSVRAARAFPAFAAGGANEKLEIDSLPGDFRALARVAYCRPQSEGFVIGLEFLEPTGRWVVNTPVGSGKPLQG